MISGSWLCPGSGIAAGKFTMFESLLPLPLCHLLQRKHDELAAVWNGLFRHYFYFKPKTAEGEGKCLSNVKFKST